MLGSLNRATLPASLPLWQLMHVLGALFGSIGAAWILRTLTSGHLIGSPTAFMVGVILFGIALLLDAIPNRFNAPSTGAQVPAGWRLYYSRWAWVPGYGFLLGLTILTRNTSWVTWAAFLVFIPIVPLAWSLAFAATYGASRASIVYLTNHHHGHVGPRMQPFRWPPGVLSAVTASLLGLSMWSYVQVS